MNFAKWTFFLFLGFLAYLIYRDVEAMNVIEKTRKKCSCQDQDKGSEYV